MLTIQSRPALVNFGAAIGLVRYYIRLPLKPETIIRLKESSQGLNENMEALKHNFLFRSYFKWEAKAEGKLKKDTEIKNGIEKGKE